MTSLVLVDLVSRSQNIIKLALSELREVWDRDITGGHFPAILHGRCADSHVHVNYDFIYDFIVIGMSLSDYHIHHAIE